MKGLSYNEIHKILGIPKSTLSGWLKDVSLSEKAQARIRGRLALGFIKRNKQQTVDAQKRAKDTREKSASEMKHISDDALLVIGTTLYWAEGYKRLRVIDGREVTSHVVGLTNSDPEIVSAFILFLTKSLSVPVEKIYIEMRLFKHMDAEETVSYWMKATGLDRFQFRKPTYPISTASRGKRPINRLPYGTVQVIVSDTKLFHRVLGLIDGLKEKLNLIKR